MFAVGTGSIDRYDRSTDTWDQWKDAGMPAHDDCAPTVVGLDGHLYFIGMTQVYTPAGSAYWVLCSL